MSKSRGHSIHFTSKAEFPDEYKEAFEKAKRLEWITIIALGSAIILMFLVMGSSQAMKSTIFDEAFGMIAAISFLLAARKFDKKPTKEFPYGYHRSITVAFLAGSAGLLVMGIYILIDSGMTLIAAERPTIGLMNIFGYEIWQGWIMIAVLLYNVIPVVILGKMKIPLAKKLHDKVVFIDADMNKAEWLGASAAIIGILGIGLGYWWADSVAAIIISGEILKDGIKNIKYSVTDLMDRTPRSVDGKKVDHLVTEVHRFLDEVSWIKEYEVRLREAGHVYFGEIILEPKSNNSLSEKIAALRKELSDFHWKLHDITIMPVEKL